MKNNNIKTFVAIGIGAALFFVLGRFVAIPSPVPNTNISLQYAVLGLLAAMYGPVAGGLIGFIGHALIDLSWGGIPWSVSYTHLLLEQINIVVDALEPGDAGQCVSLAVIAVNGSAGIRELCAEVAHIGQIAKFCVLQGRSGRFADDVGTFTGRKLGIHDGVVVGVVDELILDLNIGNSLAQIVKQCLDGVLEMCIRDRLIRP